MSEGKTVWKHIGLHGHSVGTFACDDAGIIWNSALAGKNDTGISLKRTIPKDAILSAQFSTIGKSGHVRIQTDPKSKLHHEFRFDGFPPNNFENLKEIFKDKYDIELTKLILSAAGNQFGLSRMSGKKLTFKHCILEDADEEGEVSDCLLLIFLCGMLYSYNSVPSFLFLFRNSKFGRGKKCCHWTWRKYLNASYQERSVMKWNCNFLSRTLSKRIMIN